MTDENVVLDVPSTEEKAQHYSAMQDSVNLIDEMRTNPPKYMIDEEVADCISRNVEHLEIMVAKDYWTNEDMKAVNAAIDG
tara:strand:+ start:732 stop:974 length:243 start_codon:yes stop_codon:yes gene_type:complete